MTLDGKHNEKMTHFKNINEIQIPELIAKKKHLKNGQKKRLWHIIGEDRPPS